MNTFSMRSSATIRLFYRDLGARWLHDDSRWRPSKEKNGQKRVGGFLRCAPRIICPDWKGLGMQCTRPTRPSASLAVSQSFVSRSMRVGTSRTRLTTHFTSPDDDKQCALCSMLRASWLARVKARARLCAVGDCCLTGLRSEDLGVVEANSHERFLPIISLG